MVGRVSLLSGLQVVQAISDPSSTSHTEVNEKAVCMYTAMHRELWICAAAWHVNYNVFITILSVHI